MDQYRSGEVRVLVATDVAARGLDVKDISYVINYDFPVDGVEVSLLLLLLFLALASVVNSSMQTTDHRAINSPSTQTTGHKLNPCRPNASRTLEVCTILAVCVAGESSASRASTLK